MRTITYFQVILPKEIYVDHILRDEMTYPFINKNE